MNTEKNYMKITDRFISTWLLIIFLVLSILVFISTWQAKRNLPPYVGKQLSEIEMAEVIKRNSPLTSYVHLSPNADFSRKSKIKKITIHHMGANLTLKHLGESFGKKDRKASSNYAIDNEGNVALYVEEAHRSWASSKKENDDMAITIEVANKTIGDDWGISNEAYETLINLCTDICKRNRIEKLIYTGNEIGNLTTHNMFKKDTECPGPYLKAHMGEIAKKVNENLKGDRNKY